jgi:hypothetical protein
MDLSAEDVDYATLQHELANYISFFFKWALDLGEELLGPYSLSNVIELTKGTGAPRRSRGTDTATGSKDAVLHTCTCIATEYFILVAPQCQTHTRLLSQ